MKTMNLKDFEQLMRDVALIKNILISEGELSDYAKKEIDRARREKAEEYTSLDEL